MKRIRIIVAYDGTGYCGWQMQPNGIAVEEVINRALSRLLGEPVRIIGASRTDSGVHALGNVAVFDTETRIPPERISYAMNQHLPDDIVIVRSEEVPAGWHPRYCSCVKTYEYHIFNAGVPDPTRRLNTAFISYPLNLEDMRRGAGALIGTHDFASFCSIRTGVEDTVRTIYGLEILEQRLSGGWDGRNGREITIRIRGNGFLYNMVRIIVGTLLRVGRGFYTPEQVVQILQAKNRQAAGVTAPPQGLVLVGIEYGESACP